MEENGCYALNKKEPTMRPVTFALCLLCAFSTFAQPPTTVPTTQPSEVIRLRREVDRLSAELATAKEEVARLRRVVVDAHLIPKATKEELAGFKVAKGMRVPQITKMLGEPAEITKRDDDDFYVWLVYQEIHIPLHEKSDPRRGYASSGNPFAEGVGAEADSYEVRKVVSRRIEASVKKGVVADVTETKP